MRQPVDRIRRIRYVAEEYATAPNEMTLNHQTLKRKDAFTVGYRHQQTSQLSAGAEFRNDNRLKIQANLGYAQDPAKLRLLQNARGKEMQIENASDPQQTMSAPRTHNITWSSLCERCSH